MRSVSVLSTWALARPAGALLGEGTGTVRVSKTFQETGFLDGGGGAHDHRAGLFDAFEQARGSGRPK